MGRNPLSAPQNKFILSGKPSPRFAEVTGAELKWRIEERKVNGMIGGIGFTGRELSAFNVKLHLVTRQDWEDWHNWKSLVLAKPNIIPGGMAGALTKAQDVQHPLLEDAGIRAAVVLGVHQAIPNGDLGEWVISIDFKESRGTPKPMAARVEGEQATPQDPVDKEIAGLVSQAKDLYAK